jgi:putative MATE family efflux protein
MYLARVKRRVCFRGFGWPLSFFGERLTELVLASIVVLATRDSIGHSDPATMWRCQPVKEQRIAILSTAPVNKAILVMSLPVIMGMMVQVLYNLVDTYFIGQLNDANQLAAANISLPVFMLMMAIAGLVGAGGSSYISRSLGSKDVVLASRTLAISVVICAIISLVVMLGGIAFLSTLVEALGASEATSGFAKDYVLILLFGSLPIMVNFAVGQLLRAEGDAMGSMLGMLVGTVTNIVLDPIFIFVLGMGVRGAAIATVLGNTLALVFYVYRYVSGKTLLSIRLSQFGFDKVIWTEIFTIGAPSSLSQFLMSVAMAAGNNVAAGYSDIVVAGLGVAARVMTIGTFIFIGFAAGCQPLVGYNYGARNPKRVLAIVKSAVVMTFGIGVVLTVVFGLFAPDIIGFFIEKTEVVEIGSTILRALMFSLPFVGGQLLFATSLQAMGKALPALFLSVARQGLLYLPLLFLLNRTFGFNGFVYAQPVTDAVMLVVATCVVARAMRKDMLLPGDGTEDPEGDRLTPDLAPLN